MFLAGGHIKEFAHVALIVISYGQVVSHVIEGHQSLREACSRRIHK